MSALSKAGNILETFPRVETPAASPMVMFAELVFSIKSVAVLTRFEALGAASFLLFGPSTSSICLDLLRGRRLSVPFLDLFSNRFLAFYLRALKLKLYRSVS